MFRRWLCAGVVAMLALGGSLGGRQEAMAQAGGAAAATLATAAPTTTLRPNLAAPRPAAEHPLDRVLTFARDEQAYLRSTVRDFRCRVTKRERIDGELQDFHYIDMRVREQTPPGSSPPQPFGVLLEFLGPADVEGRRVLYVAGQNDDRLLVRKGGHRFGYVVMDVDPESTVVKQQSLMPVTEIGFGPLLGRMIRTLEQDVAADPRGDNTLVEHITTATINGRGCEMLRITHPRRHDGLQFFSASVAIDSELHVPVRFDVYDWPAAAGQQPPLMSEFTYTNVSLNPNLDAATFAPAILRGP